MAFVLAFVLGHTAHRKAREVDESQLKLSELNDKLIVTNRNLENEIIERKEAEEQKSRLILERPNKVSINSPQTVNFA